MGKTVIIIGGGASGLVSGIVMARRGVKVTILEKMNKPGRKILATGNGKCNLTNTNMHRDAYRGGSAEFINTVMEAFGPKEAIAFFEELGVKLHNKNGYVYPYNGQALAVYHSLICELVHLKVKIKTNEQVIGLEKHEHSYEVLTSTYQYHCDEVVFAAGGCAASHFGSDGSGIDLAAALGHHVILPLPALTKLYTEETFFKKMSGVRAHALIQLYVDSQCVSEDEGEVQMVTGGISGIPVFQVSRFASVALQAKKKVTLQLDYIPQISSKDLSMQWMHMRDSKGYRTMVETVSGYLHEKLAIAILESMDIKCSQLIGEMDENTMGKVIRKIKCHTVRIKKTGKFEEAQTTCGGIDVSEVSPLTMESHRVQGMYFIGEMLDVDGQCGGYNLQWAWSTGAVAGRAVCRR